MKIKVEYIDNKGILSNRSYSLTRLAFAKHLAIAGQHYAPTFKKLIRTISMFFHYSFYLERQDFYNNKFSVPPEQLYDPTEKGQFSNLAGKAIADFLSKRIDGSLYTVNYEAAMMLQKMQLSGARPDLIAYTPNSIFAIEAKGYSNGPGNMAIHKKQAQTGEIPVNYNVACVSYNLYKRIKCKYHDPYNDEIPFDFDVLRELTKKYYSNLKGFLTNDFSSHKEIKINGESFYAVEINFRRLSEKLMIKDPWLNHICTEIFKSYGLQIILPLNIDELANHGLSKDTKPFDSAFSEQKNVYVDNDRVGLQINR